jgi:hypothetical protein
MGSCVSKRRKVYDHNDDRDSLGMGLMSGLRREYSDRSDNGTGKLAFDYGDLISINDSNTDEENDNGLVVEEGLSTSRHKTDPF